MTIRFVGSSMWSQEVSNPVKVRWAVACPELCVVNVTDYATEAAKGRVFANAWLSPH